MNKISLFIFIFLLLTACIPSENAIQTAIADTQAAWSPTPTQTLRPTSTPTRTKIPPTSTPKRKTYIIETGWCMLSVGDVSGSDPKNVQYCNLDARQEIEIGQNEQVTVTLNNLNGQIEVYCALFTLDSVFIMSDVDTTGSGEVTCRP